MAYFTTYTEASGGVTLNMGFSETIPKEDFSNWTKHVSVENTGGYDCYIRVKALAGSKYQDGLQYSDSDGKWTPGEDGYYYYSDPIAPGRKHIGPGYPDRQQRVGCQLQCSSCSGIHKSPVQ